MSVATPELLTVKQAAKTLGVSPATVYRMKAEKEISFVQLRRGIRFHPAALARDVEALTRKSIYQ
jgi:excisionase family DNA binding protein